MAEFVVLMEVFLRTQEKKTKLDLLGPLTGSVSRAFNSITDQNLSTLTIFKKFLRIRSIAFDRY